jgi:xylulokinase
MTHRLVIGLDSSTQSTKAIAWTNTGELIAEGRADIPMAMPQKGYYEQNPSDWWLSACTALRALCSQIDTSLIDGLAISNQRETIGFFDDDLVAVHPAIVWLDNRSINEVHQLADKIGEDRFHSINGKPTDICPSHSRLLWLSKHRPDQMKACRKISDVNSFLTAKLTGIHAASWASADPSGVFDITQKNWSNVVLEALDLQVDQFATLVAPGTFIGTILPQVIAETGLPFGTKIFAGGGDGQCAGLGVNAVGKGRIYLNLGTAIVVGTGSKSPNISKAWRTMTSPTGEGYFLEGVMRAGTFFIDWFVENYVEKNAHLDTHKALQTAAKSLPVGTDGLIVCPYLSGCMNPFWDMNARAAFFGVSPDHGPLQLYRGALEALTGEIARSIEKMKQQGLPANEIVAVGGGAKSDLWRQMLVDATDLPLTLSKSLEASSLGAGMIAAVGAGWFATFDEAANAMSKTGETFTSDKAAHQEWEKLLQRQLAFNNFCCHNVALS